MNSEYLTPLKNKNKRMYWKVHTPGLLEEIMNNQGTAILKIPLNIFAQILSEVADRAVEINDEKLNALMCRLTLYEQADPKSKDYNPKEVNALIDKYFN